MAYRRETKRILAGSMNLLPPVDLTPEPDSLQLQNFRVDQAGVLRSRRGMVHQSGYVPGGRFHTLFRWANSRYAGVGNRLYEGAAMENLVQDGLDGYPLGLAAYQGFLWVMNRAKRGRVRFFSWSEWGLAPPSSAPTMTENGDGPITGEIRYYVTFENEFGHESGPSPVSAAITVAGKSIQLHNLPLSPDPQVVKRNVYRYGGGLNPPHWVFSINDNDTTGPYLDNVDTVYSQNIGRTLDPTLDNDLPPACRGLVGPYRGKLIAFASDDHPNRYWWTPTGKPWAWPGAADDFEGYWQDCGDDGEAILAATVHNRYVPFYKESSIWRLVGDPIESDPEQTSVGFGIWGPRAFCNAGDVDYIAGGEGIYQFNGERAIKLSLKLDPLFRGEWTRVSDDVWIPPVSFDYRHLCAMTFIHGRLYFSYPEEGQHECTQTLVCDVETGRWSQYRLAPAAQATGFSALYHEGKGNALLGGLTTPSGAALYELEFPAPNDDQQAIPLIWQSRYWNQGLPGIAKVYEDVTVEFQTAAGNETPSTLTLKAGFDNGTMLPLGSLRSASRTRQIFPLGFAGRGREAENLSVRIEGDALSTCLIHGVFLNFYPLVRKAKSFDTGIRDFAAASQAKELWEVELDIRGAGPVGVQIFTDLPGGTVQLRKTEGFSLNGERQVFQRVLTTRPIGRRARLIVFSLIGDEFELYAVRLRVLPIGVYLDGSAGAVWESPAMSGN